MSKRAVLYARVSTDDQADKGYGLPAQLEGCRKYADSLGFEVVAEFQEDYSGAAPFAERPEGKRLTEMLKRREADAVIAHRVDRIARDSFEARLAVRMWLQSGVEVHACDIGRIEDDNNIVFLVMGWQAHEDRSKIIKNTTAGRRIKAQAGRVVGSNRAPFGYRFVRDGNNKVIWLEIYENEGRVVRLIFKWYVHGDESGTPLPILVIAKNLQEMGIPTPGNQVYQSRGARGVWGYSSVATILRNETYAGTWHYGCRAGSSRKRLPLQSQIAVDVPAIIDRETWLAAQARSQHNKSMAKRHAKRDYLLRRLIRCGCGRGMSGVASGRGPIRRYRCTGMCYVNPDCDSKYIRADIIEAQVWEGLKGFFSDLDRLWDKLQIAQRQELDAREPKRTEIETVADMIAQADREAGEIALAIRQAKGRVLESLQKQQDELNARYESYTKRHVELVEELITRRLTDAALGDILTFARDVREGIENATAGDKRQILELVGVEIKVVDGRYRAKCILGEWEDEIVIPRLFDSGILRPTANFLLTRSGP